MGIRRKGIVIAGLVVATALGYLIVTGMRDTMVFYYTVSEVTSQREVLSDVPLRVAGKVVAGTIAYATEDMVGIYAISVLAPFRRRGYGTALVHAAVALRPDLPVSVYPDPPSVPMYTRWGFSRAEEIACWLRASVREGR